MIGQAGRQVRTSTKPARSRVWPGQPLSPRELQVISRMCDRDEPTFRVAARDLGLAGSTVQLHMTRIYRKLGVRTRLGAYRVLVEEMDLKLRWRE